MMRADMVRNGSLRLVVMLTDEPAFLPKAELHEMLITDDNAVQAQEHRLIERRPSCFADDPIPPLDKILRRLLAFHDAARF